MRWLKLFGLLGFTSACAAELGPAIDPDALDVQFTLTDSRCSEELLRTFERRVVGGSGTIEVADIYWAGNGGYELRPAVEGPGPGNVLITITGIDHGGIAIVMCHPYSLLVAGMPAGLYKVYVAYAVEGRVQTDTVQVVTVTVE